MIDETKGGHDKDCPWGVDVPLGDLCDCSEPTLTAKEKLEKIIELLDEADALQQEVVQDNQECYSLHNQIIRIAAIFEEKLEKLS